MARQLTHFELNRVRHFWMWTYTEVCMSLDFDGQSILTLKINSNKEDNCSLGKKMTDSSAYIRLSMYNASSIASSFLSKQHLTS